MTAPRKICPRCGSTFDDPGRFCPIDGTALRLVDSGEIVVGGVVGGRYEIRKPLGRGGMGAVYLAHDIKLDRPCALKVLAPDTLPDTEALARFHREATNASRIAHPHVVAVYNFDETEDGQAYLAMEYVEGRSLAALLEEVGALSPRAAARIVWQVANALGAAHELKIVHRDLKPGNIMLTKYREWDDFVKVVDFGIAKAFGTGSGTGITSKGRWVGTPAFMSPEQWRAADVDHRSDLYSLGLVAVAMLAGGLPYDRTGPLPAGRQLLDALPPNDWPEAVKDVLARCLAPKPEDRYPSADAFATAFVGAVSGWVPPEPGVREPWEARVASAHAPSVPGPGAAPGRRRAARRPAGLRRRAGLLAAGIVSLSAAAIWYLAGSGGITPVPQAERPDSSQASPASISADPATPSSSTSMRQPPAPGIDTLTRRVPETAVSGEPGRVGASPAVVPPVEASIERLKALIDLDDPDPDSTREAVGLATVLLAESLPDSTRVEVAYRLAEGLLLLGDNAAACVRLRDIQSPSRAGAFARSVQALLERHCR